MNYSPESFVNTFWPQVPDAWTAGADNSAAIDTKGFRQAFFSTRAGTVGSSGTIDQKVQQSADGSTGWTDVTGAAITQLTATGEGKVRVKLANVQRYLRSVLTIAVATSDVGVFCALMHPVETGQANQTWIKA